MKSAFVECPPVLGGDCIALGMEPELNVKVDFNYIEISLENLILQGIHRLITDLSPNCEGN